MPYTQFQGDNLKRIVDILLSSLGLVVLSPAFLLVAAGLKITNLGPIFFRQERMGFHGKTFLIFKFRTMHVQKSDSGSMVTAENDSRITSLGKFLRRYKIDELPQLINVVRGEMALVGPRPEVPEFVRIYPREYARILEVRPGITHSVTLAFRREEEILAQSSNPQEFYIKTILPEKLAAYEVHLKQSLAQDISTIVNTIIPHKAGKPFGPEHFSSTEAGRIIPFPATTVENIPAFAEKMDNVEEINFRPSMADSRKVSP